MKFLSARDDILHDIDLSEQLAYSARKHNLTFDIDIGLAIVSAPHCMVGVYRTNIPKGMFVSTTEHAWGFSRCHYRDEFNAEHGLRKALSRAIKELVDALNTRDPDEPKQRSKAVYPDGGVGLP